MIFMVVITGLGGILFWNYILKNRVARATMELKHSRQQYMGLIESSPDMIFLVDREGGIILANHKSKSIIQGEQSEEGRTLFDLTCPEDHGILKNLLNSIYSLGSATDEIRFVFPENELRDMDLAASLIDFEWQPNIFACCFARDVTERNQFENSLIKSERLVVIGKMAAAVAHEINNPIGIVLANADEILDAELTPEETRECLESIQRNAMRAGEITRNLLSLSKPEKMTLRKVELVDVVNLSLKFLRPKLKDVKVHVIYPEDSQPISGDFKFLQQVVVNIILNAVSAMEGAPQKHLVVRFCKKLRQENVRLLFEDTGKGIPRENLVQIFEPFFSKGKENSFGLGLFTVNRIIEKHDGIVFAESDPGAGTKIVLELPRYEEKESC
ncbi:ATP-binding protein [Desulfoluna sp.]|uniref:two-component system sensor histidine kinase NtrB n=1 Tax=Desulfoluna sp. TaxID=2045199 RepID=UPI00261B397C|nr:ATP-binding protein [Desulfoluna sp.]